MNKRAFGSSLARHFDFASTWERTARRKEERGDYTNELVEEGIGKPVYVRAMGAGEGPD